MLEILVDMQNRIVSGGFKMHLMVYIVSSSIGIVLIQIILSNLLKIIARKNNVPYCILRCGGATIPF